MTRFKPDADQLAYIRARAGRESDAQIGAALGLKRAQIAHIRARHGLAGIPGGRTNGVALRWTPEGLAQLHDLYIAKGLPADRVAEIIGDTTAGAVRRKAATCGWKRDPDLAHRNRWASRRGRQAEAPAPPPPPAAASAAASDAEIIARYLAERPPTQCPPGHAAGLTNLEIHTGFTARPESALPYREKHKRTASAGVKARERAA